MQHLNTNFAVNIVKMSSKSIINLEKKSKTCSRVANPLIETGQGLERMSKADNSSDKAWVRLQQKSKKSRIFDGCHD